MIQKYVIHKQAERLRHSQLQLVTRILIAATNETKEQTAFINCVAWGKLGEAVGNYRKGNRLFVEGRIQTRSYETQDGQKKYVTEVIAGFVGLSALNDAEAGSNLIILQMIRGTMKTFRSRWLM